LRPAAAISIVIGVLSGALHLTVSSELQVWLVWDLFMITAVGASFYGVFAHSGFRKPHWRLFLAGMTSFLAAGLWATGEALHGGSPLTDRTPADAITLVGYVCLLTALLSLAKARNHRRARAGLIDALIIVGGVGLALWVVVIGPQVTAAGLTGAERAVAVGPPAFTLILLAALLRLTFSPGSRGVAYALLLLAGSLNLAAELWSLTALQDGTYGAGHPLDLLWIASYLCVALTVLHPSMKELDAEVPHDGDRLTEPRILMFAAAMLAGPASLLLTGDGDGTDTVVVIVGASILFLLMLVRIWTLMTGMRTRESHYRSIVQNSMDAIMLLNGRLQIVYASPSITNITGRHPDEYGSSPLGEWIVGDSVEEIEALIRLGGRDVPDRITCRLERPDGSAADVEFVVTNLLGDKAVRRIVLNVRDVSERVELEKQLRHQALHDPLTGLGNRSLFSDRLYHALERSARTRETCYVLFLDLNDFKVVNDTYGHHVGDECLQATGARLLTAIRSSDTLARMGGDEFAILMESCALKEATSLAERILSAMAEPLDLSVGKAPVSPSIGIAAAPPGTDPERALRDSDVAMYAAKRDRGGTYRVFERAMLKRRAKA
jgi:diguanylate cyclase (GGDEF)-like protein/PAS domain S-box-containing protein